MKLIVGLGNPGKEYVKTRHNIGFMAIDKYIENKNLNSKEKFGGIYYETNINGEKAILLKPQKYINLSGEVIIQFVKFFKINIDDVLIIHDDLDMPVGKTKLRMSGGSGGHNGLKNIELYFKTKNYKRIKVGISNNKNIDTKNYVLGKFNNDDNKIIEESLNKIVNIIDDLPKLTFENLMNKYN
ncbi:MAG: aminoacyl-tRNA hydrolase [Bacilli bacterium]|jgi:PTH1 family peptidyl-tRNA hydrolase|nr:aminoacyl-tRNA hydrolase [Bacilli bacterium]